MFHVSQKHSNRLGIPVREHNNPFTIMLHMTDLKLILPFKKVDGKRYFCSKAGLKRMKIAASGPHALYPRYFSQL